MFNEKEDMKSMVETLKEEKLRLETVITDNKHFFRNLLTTLLSLLKKGLVVFLLICFSITDYQAS